MTLVILPTGRDDRPSPNPLSPRSEWSAPSGRSRRLLAGWGAETGVLLVIAVVLPTAIAAHYGSLDAPNSDDWAYDLAAYHLAFHGGISLFHWGPSNLIGQLVLAVPLLRIFGPHAWVLNVWTSFMGLFALLAIDYTGRRLGLTRLTSLCAAAVLGLGPMWAALSSSFMLDIPALSLMSIALAVAASDARTDRLITCRSLLALAIAGVAFTIRDEALVAFLAIAWCRLWRLGRPVPRNAFPWLGAVSIAGLGLLTFELWRLGLPSSGHGSATIPPSTQWQQDEWMLPMVGLLLTPVALWIRPVSTIRRSFQTCRLWLVAGLAFMPAFPILVFVGRQLDYLHSGGLTADSLVRAFSPRMTIAYFETLGFSPAGPSAWIRLPLGVLAIVSTAVVVAALTSAAHTWVRGTTTVTVPVDSSAYTMRLLSAVVAGSWIIYIAGIMLDYQAWDRYILPLVAYMPLSLAYISKSATFTYPQKETRRCLWHQRLLAGLSIGGIAAMGTIGACSVDGFTGSEWSYSAAFAASVPSTPKRLIYTYWVWTGSQNRYMDYSDQAYTIKPGYQPCYRQAINGPPAPGELDIREAGSWVEPLKFAMLAAPDAANDPSCMLPKANVTAPADRTVLAPR